MAAKLLIIEDDIELSETLRDFFEQNGFEAFKANTGSSGLKLFFEQKPQLVVLDVRLPDITGFEVITEIRKTDCCTPVIFMTGTELSIESQVTGFSLGAISYLPKPVEPLVLLAQVNRLLLPAFSGIYNVGNLSVSFNNQSVYINGAEFVLREKDVVLFELLLKRVNQVVSRKEIMMSLWNDAGANRNNQLDVAINRLKRIVDPFPDMQIKSVYGNGYRLTIVG